MEFYKAEENRYADMIYRRCGRSGILLPAVSLGLWHNFGSVDAVSYTHLDVYKRQHQDRGAA